MLLTGGSVAYAGGVGTGQVQPLFADTIHTSEYFSSVPPIVTKDVSEAAATTPTEAYENIYDAQTRMPTEQTGALLGLSVLLGLIGILLAEYRVLADLFFAATARRLVATTGGGRRRTMPRIHSSTRA